MAKKLTKKINLGMAMGIGTSMAIDTAEEAVTRATVAVAKTSFKRSAVAIGATVAGKLATSMLGLEGAEEFIDAHSGKVVGLAVGLDGYSFYRNYKNVTDEDVEQLIAQYADSETESDDQ